MSHHRERRQAWDAILANDDAQGAAHFLSGTTQTEAYTFLAAALAAIPRPESALLALVEAGALNPQSGMSWVVHVGKRNEKVDWGQALAWRTLFVGREAAEEEIRAGATRLYSEHISKHDPRAQTLVKRAVVGLLDAMPALATEFLTQHQYGEKHLFYLAMESSSTDWLEQSGLPIEPIILGGMEGTGGTLFTPDDEDGRSSFEHWLSQGAGRRKAWESVITEDQAMETAFLAWRETWMPNGWSGSPMEQWYAAVKHGQAGPGDPNPLGKVSSKTTTGEEHEFYRCADILHEFFKKPDRDQDRHIYNIATWNTGRAAGGKALRALPLDPYVIGLDEEEDLAVAMAKTEAGARQAQALLARDERTERAFWHMSPKYVVDMILDQPLWSSWRDGKGRSVLDLTMARDHDVTLPKALLMKLARKHAHILSNQDEDGSTTLERLNIKPETKSAIRRALLERESKANRAAPRSKSRM